MRDYIIATDSCCDFDENLIRELDLTVIPLSVHLGQDHFRNYPGEMPESHVFYTRPVSYTHLTLPTNSRV